MGGISVQEFFPDDFTRLMSEARSHIGGVVSTATTKAEKIHYGFMALEKLRQIENIWHGVEDAPLPVKE